MATVTIDSGELPSAKGKKGYDLDQVLLHWGKIADGRFEYDCRALLQMIDEVDDLRLWEYACEGFYKTRDEFLEKVVLIDFDLTEHSLTEIVSRLRSGEKFGIPRLYERTAPLPLTPWGGDRKSAKFKERQNQKSDRSLIPRSNETQTYLIARLKRDAPEIGERLANGEFKSVRSAAIAAGIIKPPSPLDLLRSAWKKASQEERDTFKVEINK